MSQGAREFLGIPYAAPPARFTAPRPARPWNGVRSATAHGPACIQFQPLGVPAGQATSENCLYLDVYTPKGTRPGASLPVLFWIHGGNFTQGSGADFGGQRFASLTNSVFVSINYRLGPYGFLALASPQAAGPCGSRALPSTTAAQQVIVNTPAYDTPMLPEPPAQALGEGHWNKVPVIVGGVHDEGKLFFDTMTGMTAGQYADDIATQYRSLADAVLAHYPVRDYPAPFYARAAVFTDSIEACPDYTGASTFASQVPTWEEEFDDPASPAIAGHQPQGVNMSNAHSAELAFLWNFTLIARPLTAAQQRLGARMDQYWAAFARTGNPNAQGQAAWPRVTPTAHPVLDFRPAGNTVSTAFPAEHKCDFWPSPL